MFDKKFLQLITSIISPILSLVGMNFRDTPKMCAVVFTILLVLFFLPDMSIVFVVIIVVMCFAGFIFLSCIMYMSDRNINKGTEKLKQKSTRILELQKSDKLNGKKVEKLIEKYNDTKKV